MKATIETHPLLLNKGVILESENDVEKSLLETMMLQGCAQASFARNKKGNVELVIVPVKDEK